MGVVSSIYQHESCPRQAGNIKVFVLCTHGKYFLTSICFIVLSPSFVHSTSPLSHSTWWVTCEKNLLMFFTHFYAVFPFLGGSAPDLSLWKFCGSRPELGSIKDSPGASDESQLNPYSHQEKIKCTLSLCLLMWTFFHSWSCSNSWSWKDLSSQVGQSPREHTLFPRK